MRHIGLNAERLIEIAKCSLNKQPISQSDEIIIKAVAIMIEENNKVIFQQLKHKTDIIRDTVNP